MPSAADLLRLAVTPPTAVVRHARSLAGGHAAPSLQNLRSVRRLLARAPLVHVGLTAFVCTLVTQHPMVVLALMLGFPVMLVAQEMVDGRIRDLTAAERETGPRSEVSSVTAVELAILAEAQRAALAGEPGTVACEAQDDARHPLTRRHPPVGTRPDPGTSTAAA